MAVRELFILLFLLLSCEDFIVVLVPVGTGLRVGDSHIKDGSTSMFPKNTVTLIATLAGDFGVLTLCQLLLCGLLR